MKVCPKCGTQKQDSEKFCDQCGSLLEVKNEVPVAAPAQAPAPQVQAVAQPAPVAPQAPAPQVQPAPVAPQAPVQQYQAPAQPQPQYHPQPQQPHQPQQPQYQAPQAPAYPMYAQQPQYQAQPQQPQQVPQQRPQAPVQQPQYQAQPQQSQYQVPQAPVPQYQQPVQQPQYQQPYAAPVQAPYQQYSPSAFPQKKGVDVLAIIACVLAIFIFVAPFLKTYVAKMGGRSGEAESQYNVVKNTIETLNEKVNSSLITQYRILTIAFAVLIVIALAVWIPALIHACKGNNLKAWRFVTLMCIFALTANVCYMFGMKAFADAYNVTRNARAYKLEPNAIFIIALALISALLITSIVKRSLMKKQPQTV